MCAVGVASFVSPCRWGKLSSGSSTSSTCGAGVWAGQNGLNGTRSLPSGGSACTPAGCDLPAHPAPPAPPRLSPFPSQRGSRPDRASGLGTDATYGIFGGSITQLCKKLMHREWELRERAVSPASHTARTNLHDYAVCMIDNARSSLARKSPRSAPACPTAATRGSEAEGHCVTAASGALPQLAGRQLRPYANLATI